jgi:hypothetical protein
MHTDTKKVQRNTDGAQKPSKSPTCLGAASNGVLTAKAEGSIPTSKNKHAACEHTRCTALSAFINPRHAYTSWPAESYKPTTMQPAHSKQSTAFNPPSPQSHKLEYHHDAQCGDMQGCPILGLALCSVDVAGKHRCNLLLWVQRVCGNQAILGHKQIHHLWCAKGWKLRAKPAV